MGTVIDVIAEAIWENVSLNLIFICLLLLTCSDYLIQCSRLKGWLKYVDLFH